MFHGEYNLAVFFALEVGKNVNKGFENKVFKCFVALPRAAMNSMLLMLLLVNNTKRQAYTHSYTLLLIFPRVLVAAIVLVEHDECVPPEGKVSDGASENDGDDEVGVVGHDHEHEAVAQEDLEHV